MSRTVTLDELRTQVRARSDQESSNFISDAELDEYINGSIAKLYGILCDKYGEEWYTNATPVAVSVVAGTDSYDIEDTTFKIAGVDVLVGGVWVSIHKYASGDRNRAQDASFIKDVKYRLIGNKLRFTPVPTANHSVRYWEVPPPTKLVDDDDTFDGIAGWEEFVVLDAAIKILAKEESDTTDLRTDKNEIYTLIDRSAENRDIGEPEEIQDIYSELMDSDMYVLGNW